MTIVSPVFVYMFGSPELLAKYPLAEIIGLRWPGLAQASGKSDQPELPLVYFLSFSVFPLVLTMVLFLGPTVMLLCDVGTYFCLKGKYIL